MCGDSYASRRLRGKNWGYVTLLGIAFLVVAGAGVNMLLAGVGAIHDSSEPHDDLLGSGDVALAQARKSRRAAVVSSGASSGT